MLQVTDLDVFYGAASALTDANLTATPGEIIALVGANGAGKSTLLAAIAGIVRAGQGRIMLGSEDLTRLPAYARTAKGICLLPEAGGVFLELTVDENLQLSSALVRNAQEKKRRRERVYSLFPVLAERLRQRAGTLSGGERQMLALSRGVLMQPQVLMLDEPSLGLAPQVVEQVAELIVRINREQGATILLAEQNSRMALTIAHRAYILENGRIIREGTAAGMAQDPSVLEAYLGATLRN